MPFSNRAHVPTFSNQIPFHILHGLDRAGIDVRKYFQHEYEEHRVETSNAAQNYCQSTLNSYGTENACDGEQYESGYDSGEGDAVDPIEVLSQHLNRLVGFEYVSYVLSAKNQITASERESMDRIGFHCVVTFFVGESLLRRISMEKRYRPPTPRLQ